MARLTRKRRPDPFWPEPAPTPVPFPTSFRIRKSFSVGGFRFPEGGVVAPNNPLVVAFAAEYPELVDEVLEVARHPASGR